MLKSLKDHYSTRGIKQRCYRAEDETALWQYRCRKGRYMKNPRRALQTFKVHDLIGASHSKSHLVVYIHGLRIIVEHELHI